MREISDYFRSNGNSQYENFSVREKNSNTNTERMEQNDIIDLSGKNALKAVIYSEIIGKPRCKSKRKRWR